MRDLEHDEQSAHLSKETAVLETTYRSSIDQYRIATELVVENIIRQPEILTLFERSVNGSEAERELARKELYDRLLPFYESLLDKGIQIVHFHAADTTSILRFYIPDQKDDVLRDCRASVVLANQEQRVVSGFEMGRVKSAFRHVYPLSLNGEHLGSVELSVPFSQVRMAMSVLDPSHEYQLLLRKKVVFDRLSEDRRAYYPASTLSPDYLEEPGSTTESPQHISDILAQLIHNKEVSSSLASDRSFTVPVQHDGVYWAVSFAPVYDVEQQVAGYYISYAQDSHILSLLREFRFQLGIGTLLLVGVFWAVGRIVWSRRELINEKQHLQTITDTIGDGLYIMDSKGLITEINTTFTELLGYGPADIVGRIGHNIFHCNGRSERKSDLEECDIFRVVSENNNFDGEASFIHKDGRVLSVEFNSRPFALLSGEKASITAFRDVTEKKRAERSLAAYRLKLEELLEQRTAELTVAERQMSDTLKAMDQAGIGCHWVDGKSAEIVYSNRSAASMLGYTPEELMGLSVPDIDPYFTRERFDEMGESLAEIRSVRIESEQLHRDGHHVPVELSLFWMEGDSSQAGKFIAFITDITNRKQIEQSTREAKDAAESASQMLRLILDTIPVRVFWKDLDLNYLGCNRLFAKDGGFSCPDDVIGLCDFDMGWREQADLYRADDWNIIRNDEVRLGYEEPQTTPDGRLIWLRTSKIPLKDASGTVIGILGAYEDISGWKVVESELREARNAAEDATRAKSRFLASMSHEIRTPMNGILGMMYLALQTDLNDRQKNFISKAHRSAENLRGILNDILDFSKIEAGRMELEIIDFRLKDVLDGVLGMISVKADEKKIHVESHVDERIPCTLSGDPLRLGQVLSNLCGNAVKFCGENDSIRLFIKLHSKDEDELILHFSVQDTGIGMSEKQHQSLFRAFSQADLSTSRKYGGTGLGLVISKNIVEMMGGGIWVESKEHEGSTFHFTICLGAAQEEDISSPVVSRNTDDKSDRLLSGIRVLLVDDNEINLELVQELLLHQGAEVTSADSGLSALKLLDEQKFDVVLMDCQMPIMNGYEAIGRIRERDDLKALPVIALTANATPQDRQKVLAVGMNDHLSKPINPSDLFDTIKRWVSPGVPDE
ncbi:MAG: PAS domain S-box protein [Pontiellaceae bacterium]|nr:PAS domain S-box protein [Pontiellaceae bacterium]MBN2783515.1 PAS domain S-box protein [Pontiellaceae bacterium]